MSALHPTTPRFKNNVKEALANQNIQSAMSTAGGFAVGRAKARAEMPEFDAIRDQARDLKNHVLANLADYLEQYEAKVQADGGHVHRTWGVTDPSRLPYSGMGNKEEYEVEFSF